MKISVITATYNRESTIGDTLRSLLQQTFQNYECIIIDGASTDRTLEIVRELEPQFAGRLHIVSEKDDSIYDAMNKGIKMSTGDVLGIINSDDFFTSNDVLEIVAKNMMDNSIDAVYGDVHYVRPDNLTKCVRYYSSKHFHPRWFRLGFIPAHPSFYCRRKCYELYGAYDIQYQISADFELMLRFMKIHSIRTKYLPMDFVTMRYGGVTTSGWTSHQKITHEILRALKNNGIYSNIILVNSRYIFKLINLFYFKYINRK